MELRRASDPEISEGSAPTEGTGAWTSICRTQDIFPVDPFPISRDGAVLESIMETAAGELGSSKASGQETAHHLVNLAKDPFGNHEMSTVADHRVLFDLRGNFFEQT